MIIKKPLNLSYVLKFYIVIEESTPILIQLKHTQNINPDPIHIQPSANMTMILQTKIYALPFSESTLNLANRQLLATTNDRVVIQELSHTFGECIIFSFVLGICWMCLLQNCTLWMSSPLLISHSPISLQIPCLNTPKIYLIKLPAFPNPLKASRKCLFSKRNYSPQSKSSEFAAGNLHHEFAFVHHLNQRTCSFAKRMK